MKKTCYLFLILALPVVAVAQTTTQKKTTTTKVTTKKSTAPAKKPVAGKPVQSNKVAPVPVNISFTPFINNDHLMLTGSFVPTKTYLVKIVDEKGATAFTTYFKAGEGAHDLEMGKPLPQGTYQIMINGTDNPFESGNITLVIN